MVVLFYNCHRRDEITVDYLSLVSLLFCIVLSLFVHLVREEFIADVNFAKYIQAQRHGGKSKRRIFPLPREVQQTTRVSAPRSHPLSTGVWSSLYFFKGLKLSECYKFIVGILKLMCVREVLG
ncbi:hypothetical protein Y032_0558g3427 [Ancylostoma ceylanicum]|uniref:Uncharacterized protein n=1 Tax=Ancylostoma ceylanicum TaxID=53326 RepID=A0A016WQ77_9BILA|nr:hypothetical protein Y032_0558g3427 [Ancylostoma ceylanicum]